MEKQQTVLIVEDEKNIVDILRFNLQKEGYACLLYTSPSPRDCS